MTVTQEIRTKAEKLAEQIAKFGVKVKAYARGPVAPEILALAITKGTLMVWPGTAEVTVRGSSAKRQAVLNVTESKRTVTRRVSLSSVRLKNDWDGRTVLSLRKPTVTDELRNRLISAFPVSFPNSNDVTWEVKDLVAEEIPGALDYGTATAEVTAIVPATKQSFLVGYDENDLFVSMLPKQATSVKHAHELLRPKGVDADAPRQGEWFFQPVSDTVSEQLDALVAKRPHVLDEPGDLGWLELDGEYRDTEHYASTIEHNKKHYAIGWVTDRRGQSHHEPLFLCEWHQVFKNLELDPPDSVSGQSRTWD